MLKIVHKVKVNLQIFIELHASFVLMADKLMEYNILRGVKQRYHSSNASSCEVLCYFSFEGSLVNKLTCSTWEHMLKAFLESVWFANREDVIPQLQNT